MSMTPLDGMKSGLSSMLRGIERYNPENMSTLERYVDVQAKENGYDLEANLALLKLYQFNPNMLKMNYVCMILLKALTNLPHSDYVLCKCLVSQAVLEDAVVQDIELLHDLLETCKFEQFWHKAYCMVDIIRPISGFDDSIRKYVCHVVSITYQHVREELLDKLLGLVDENAIKHWISKNGWRSENGYVLISQQEDSIKTKKITEKIDLDSVAGIMASCF